MAAQKNGVGDRTNDPGRNSLRLLPSGPDRVGEGPVRRRPPTPLYQAATGTGQPRRTPPLAAHGRRVHAAENQRRVGMSALPDDGLVAVVKRDCPTCVLTAPVPG